MFGGFLWVPKWDPRSNNDTVMQGPNIKPWYALIVLIPRYICACVCSKWMWSSWSFHCYPKHPLVVKHGNGKSNFFIEDFPVWASRAHAFFGSRAHAQEGLTWARVFGLTRARARRVVSLTRARARVCGVGPCVPLNHFLHSTSLFKLTPPAFHYTIVAILLLYLNLPLLLYLNLPSPAFHYTIVTIILLYLNFPPAFHYTIVSILLLYLNFPPCVPLNHCLHSTSLFKLTPPAFH